MTIKASSHRVIVTMDRSVVAWLDEQSFQRERERSWIVEKALRRWQRSLERDRERRRLQRLQPQ